MRCALRRPADAVLLGMLALRCVLAARARRRTSSSTRTRHFRSAPGRSSDTTVEVQLRGRAGLLPLPRAVQVQRDRRDARRAGASARQGQVRRDLPQGRRDLSRRASHRVAGGAGSRRRSRSIVTSQGCADEGLCYPPHAERLQASGSTGFGGTAACASSPRATCLPRQSAGPTRSPATDGVRTATTDPRSARRCRAGASGRSSAPSSSPACCCR